MAKNQSLRPETKTALLWGAGFTILCIVFVLSILTFVNTKGSNGSGVSDSSVNSGNSFRSDEWSGQATLTSDGYEVELVGKLDKTILADAVQNGRLSFSTVSSADQSLVYHVSAFNYTPTDVGVTGVTAILTSGNVPWTGVTHPSRSIVHPGTLVSVKVTGTNVFYLSALASGFF